MIDENNTSLSPETEEVNVTNEAAEHQEEGLFAWEGQERTWLLAGASWYFYGAIVAVLLLFYALLTQAWTMAVLISLLAGIIFLYSQEQAPKVEVVISSKGIYIAEEFYSFSLIKSAWFSVDHKGHYLVFSLLNNPRARISISFQSEEQAALEVILREFVVIDEFHQDTWWERIEKMF
ncbi:MAG: hypothetical protein HY817_05890 [Candidatus Abawacabacteria bacterium]|nr:hypothetical protein [Candidatus Abawacabacteria bacterium]